MLRLCAAMLPSFCVGPVDSVCSSTVLTSTCYIPPRRFDHCSVSSVTKAAVTSSAYYPHQRQAFLQASATCSGWSDPTPTRTPARVRVWVRTNVSMHMLNHLSKRTLLTPNLQLGCHAPHMPTRQPPERASDAGGLDEQRVSGHRRRANLRV
jgi:hypothetical protein